MIGIVVVNYGSSALLRTNLAPLVLNPARARVFVVDNFTSAAEVDDLARLVDAQGWDLATLPANQGFGAGVNLGVRRAADAGCDSFLILNPDAIVTADVVDALQDHAQREPMALISPLVRSTRRGTTFDGAFVDRRTGRIRSRHAVERDRRVDQEQSSHRLEEWLPATALAVHADLLHEIGGFDEPYFLYWEDVDLSHRCLRAGGTLVVREDLVALHDEGGTQPDHGQRGKSNVYYYYNCRNRLLFAARHLGRRDRLRWLIHTPAQSWQILMRGGRRQLLASPAPLWAVLRGSVAGVGLVLGSLGGRGTSRPPDVIADRALAEPSP